MEKIKYIPLGLFIAFCLKIAVLGPSLTESLCLLILGAVAVTYEYKSNSKEIKGLEDKLSALSTRADSKDKEIDELKSYVSSMKMSQAFQRK